MKHPILAYSGKEACLRHFESSPNCYEKLYPVAQDILRIGDTIQAEVPEQYKKLEDGKFRGPKGCDPSRRRRKSPIIGGTTEYPFPSGYVYPIVAAFRSMVVDTGGQFGWGKGVDPCQLIREGLAARLFSGSVVNSIKDNHNKTGKDANVWALAYQMAENFYLRL